MSAFELPPGYTPSQAPEPPVEKEVEKEVEATGHLPQPVKIQERRVSQTEIAGQQHKLSVHADTAQAPSSQTRADQSGEHVQRVFLKPLVNIVQLSVEVAHDAADAALETSKDAPPLTPTQQIVERERLAAARSALDSFLKSPTTHKLELKDGALVSTPRKQLAPEKEEAQLKENLAVIERFCQQHPKMRDEEFTLPNGKNYPLKQILADPAPLTKVASADRGAMTGGVPSHVSVSSQNIKTYKEKHKDDSNWGLVVKKDIAGNEYLDCTLLSRTEKFLKRWDKGAASDSRVSQLCDTYGLQKELEEVRSKKGEVSEAQTERRQSTSSKIGRVLSKLFACFSRSSVVETDLAAVAQPKQSRSQRAESVSVAASAPERQAVQQALKALPGCLEPTGFKQDEAIKHIKTIYEKGNAGDKSRCSDLIMAHVKERVVFLSKTDAEGYSNFPSEEARLAERAKITAEVKQILLELQRLDATAVRNVDMVELIGAHGQRSISPSERHVIRQVQLALGRPAIEESAPKKPKTEKEISASRQASEKPVAEMNPEYIQGVFDRRDEKEIVALLAKSKQFNLQQENALLKAIVTIKPFSENVIAAIDKSRLLHKACESFSKPPEIAESGKDAPETGKEKGLVSQMSQGEIEAIIQIRADAALHLIDNLPEDSFRVLDKTKVPLQIAQAASQKIEGNETLKAIVQKLEQRTPEALKHVLRTKFTPEEAPIAFKEFRDP